MATCNLWPEMRIDPSRYPEDSTGIYVRAQDDTGAWRTVDIASLDKASLLVWIRSGGGVNRLAENVVGALLGHGSLHHNEEPTTEGANE